jgi:hypothetical protein
MFIFSSNMQDRARWTKKFCDRWIARTAHYNVQTLNGSVDTFFSLYVAYNRLCSYLALTLEDPSKFDNVTDTAIKVFPAALGSERIWTVASEGDGLADITCLGSLIADDGGFFLFPKKGTFGLESNKSKNKILHDKLVSSDTDKRVEGLLHYLYGVRCNAFHGGKDLRESQLKILQPSVRCLERIIKLGMDEVTRQSQDSSPPTH